MKIPVTPTISSTCLPAASPLQEQVDAVENRKERTETHTHTCTEDKSQSCHPDFQMKWGIRMEVKAC